MALRDQEFAVSYGLRHGNLEMLAANPYPGRGIVLGVSEGGEQAVQAYWVMGRSENSRNRVLTEADDVVKTEAFDPSKVEDPSLIIYNAMRAARRSNTLHIVSNGDQTDTVYGRVANAITSSVKEDRTAFRNALLGRKHEPDAPNFTPRITGMISAATQTFDYSIIRRNRNTDQAEHTFGSGKLADLPEGSGVCFHTYDGDAPSKDAPIPSFGGSPYAVNVGGNADEIADAFWSKLNPQNRVALAVKTIDRRTGEVVIKIVNQLQR